MPTIAKTNPSNYYYPLYMKKAYRIEKNSADKLALLGLLIVSLIIAQIIVVAKSGITLSQAVTLKYCGVSISVPIGKRWKTEKKWQFHDNSFVLMSAFSFEPANPETLVHCKYLLAAPKDKPETQLDDRVAKLKGLNVKRGQTTINNLVVNWVHIEKQNIGFNLFAGIVQLPDNRQLNIEVHQGTGNSKLAEKIFNLVIESLKFEDNPLLSTGNRIVKEIKNIGINNFIYNESIISYFLIQDEKKQTIGFFMDSVIDSEPNEKLNILAESYFYMRGQYTQEQTSLLRSSNDFAEFLWKSETSSISGITTTQTTRDEEGTISITKFSPRPEKNIYQVNSASIPDAFLDFAYIQLLDSRDEKCIIDIIQADGVITPVLISKVKPPFDADYMLEVEFLNNSEMPQQIFLDNQKQISKILLYQDVVFTIKRASKEDILREFPQRAEYIIQKNKI